MLAFIVKNRNMTRLNAKILKFLHKNDDGKFLDVSKAFNVINPLNYLNYIESDEDSLCTSINEINSVKPKHKLFCHSINKDIIDNHVISLEEKGYVTKNFSGRIYPSQLSPDDDKANANNSICKITAKGIEYYENYIHNSITRGLSLLAIIISIVALTISFCR